MRPLEGIRTVREAEGENIAWPSADVREQKYLFIEASYFVKK